METSHDFCDLLDELVHIAEKHFLEKNQIIKNYLEVPSSQKFKLILKRSGPKFKIFRRSPRMTHPQTGIFPNRHILQFFCAIENLSPPTAGVPYESYGISHLSKLHHRKSPKNFSKIYFSRTA